MPQEEVIFPSIKDYHKKDENSTIENEVQNPPPAKDIDSSL